MMFGLGPSGSTCKVDLTSQIWLNLNRYASVDQTTEMLAFFSNCFASSLSKSDWCFGLSSMSWLRRVARLSVRSSTPPKSGKQCSIDERRQHHTNEDGGDHIVGTNPVKKQKEVD